jgi:hypothetical protein
MHQFDMSLLEYLQQHVHKDGDRRVDVAQMVRVIIQVGTPQKCFKTGSGIGVCWMTPLESALHLQFKWGSAAECLAAVPSQRHLITPASQQQAQNAHWSS